MLQYGRHGNHRPPVGTLDSQRRVERSEVDPPVNDLRGHVDAKRPF